MIYLELFFGFLQIGLFSIGGGYAAIPLIQNQFVEKNAWISLKEFTDLVTVAEMTPGPIAINSATFIGIRIAGFPGALIATLGCIFPSLIIVSILAYIYFKYKKMSALQSVLSTLRSAVVALIATAGLSMLIEIAFKGNSINLENIDMFSVFLFVFALFAIRKLKKNPILIMCMCGCSYLTISLLLS